MAIINPLPNNLTNGTTADATQVMANFNEIFNDTNTNAAHNGANSDITSITGLDVLIYPMPVWNVFEEKLAQLPTINRAKMKFQERLNTFGQVCRMDAQGRLLIPSLLRDQSGIAGDALVLGQTDFLKLVDRAKHLKSLKASTVTDEDYDELSRHLV